MDHQEKYLLAINIVKDYIVGDKSFNSVNFSIEEYRKIAPYLLKAYYNAEKKLSMRPSTIDIAEEMVEIDNETPFLVQIRNKEIGERFGI